MNKHDRSFRTKQAQALWLFRRHRNLNLLATPGKHEFVIVLDHLKAGYNIGKIFRSADAFGAREIHLIGVDFFDPAPAMGSFKAVPAKFHKIFASTYEDLLARGYTLFMLDPSNGDLLMRAALPAKSAFIFGHEQFGFSFTKAEFPALQSLAIPQFGQVQSLNVSVAASIVMYEYIRQHGV
ncbi:MAG: TrmH family RNA methyltransferase [Gammaproteobacteria bacterium]